VFLTWSEEPQRFEEELMALHGRREMPLEEVARALERLQERIDRAHIKNDEWDLLYRLRLQVERDAYERGRAEARSRRTA
jgi:hypothetical protein